MAASQTLNQRLVPEAGESVETPRGGEAPSHMGDAKAC